MDWFSAGHRIFEEDMIEAKDVTDRLFDGLTPGHVFPVLERDTRSQEADLGRFLSWRRTLKFIPRIDMGCCYNIPCSQCTQGKEEDSLVFKLFWKPAPPLSTKLSADPKLGTNFRLGTVTLSLPFVVNFGGSICLEFSRIMERP